MSMMSSLARWIKSEADLETKESDKRKLLEQMRASRPPVFDIAANVKHNRKCADIEAEIEAIAAARTVAAAEKAKAEQTEAVAEEDRREAEVRKLGLAHAKLTIEIFADIDALNAKLEKHGVMAADIEAWNRTRGTRRHIEDGEYRVRKKPSPIVPAITETQQIWVDRHGNFAKSEILNDEGKYIRNPAIVGKGERVQVIRPEYQLPDTIPTRLADAIKLVNLAGEEIWPPR